MKPIIIIKETNKEGKFELTEQELKELIEKAYEQGFADGRPKATLPQSQYDRPEDGIYYRGIGLGNGPKDVYGNPVPYCSTDKLPYTDADGNYHPGSASTSSAETNLNVKAFQ